MSVYARNADELSAAKQRGMSRLRWERIRRGLSMRDVMSELGISSTSVLAYWETGETTPEPYRRFMLAQFYGVPERELFTRAWQAPRPAQFRAQRQRGGEVT